MNPFPRNVDTKKSRRLQTLFVLLILGVLLYIGAFGSFLCSGARSETTSQIMQFCISPDGHKLVYAVTEGPWSVNVRLCELERHEEVSAGNEYATDLISWSPDSKLFAYSSLGAPKKFEEVAIKVFDTEKGYETTIVNEGATFLPTFSPVDRSLLALVRKLSREKYLLYLFDLRNKKMSLLESEPLAKEAVWCWDSKGQEIYYSVKGKDAFIIRAVNVLDFSRRDVLSLSSSPEELQFVSEGEALSIVDNSGLIILSSSDGTVLDRIRPSDGLYRGLAWRGSRQVAFLICKNETSIKCDLAISGDKLKTFKRVAEGLPRTYIERSRMAWLTDYSLAYHDGSQIVLVDANGKRLRNILSLDE